MSFASRISTGLKQLFTAAAERIHNRRDTAKNIDLLNAELKIIGEIRDKPTPFKSNIVDAFERTGNASCELFGGHFEKTTDADIDEAIEKIRAIKSATLDYKSAALAVIDASDDLSLVLEYISNVVKIGFSVKKDDIDRLVIMREFYQEKLNDAADVTENFALVCGAILPSIHPARTDIELLRNAFSTHKKPNVAS